MSSETHRARNSEHDEHFYRTVMIIKYHCPQCDALVTRSQGLNTLGAMLGFFFGGVAGMAFLIGLHDALSGGLAMGLFFLCPLLGFAIGSLIGKPQRDQERLDSVTTKIFKLGPQRCAAYAFFAFAVLFWVISVAISIPAIRLAMAGERVEGIVAETREPQYDDEYPRVAVIRFSVGHRKVELKRSGSFQVGETLPVVYLPSDPDVAEIDTFDWLHSDWAISAAFGCLPAIVSLFFYVASRRPAWARKDR